MTGSVYVCNLEFLAQELMDNSTMLFLLTTLPKMQTRRDCLSKRSPVNDQCVAPYKTEYLLYVMYAHICDPICCFLSLCDDRLSISFSLIRPNRSSFVRWGVMVNFILKIRFLTKISSTSLSLRSTVCDALYLFHCQVYCKQFQIPMQWWNHVS